MPRIRKFHFRGKQQNLYTLSRKAWGYCLDHISDINKAKPLYTPSFVAAQLGKVEVAEAIPDYLSRRGMTVEARQGMEAAGLAITDKWQLLKGYITDAFDRSLLKTKLDAAGQAHYSGATNRNWDSVASLILATKLFLEANGELLSANDNMPRSFASEFNALATDFTNLRNGFFDKDDDKDALNSEKEAADAAILETLLPMLKLAQRIYKNEPDKRSLFIYESLLGQVRGNQAAGLKGTATAADSKLPLANATIKAVGTDEEAGTYTATTDAKGRFELNMASGVYDMEVSAPGYQSVQVANRKVEVGVKHRLNPKLELDEFEAITKELLSGAVASTASAEAQSKSNGVAAMM